MKDFTVSVRKLTDEDLMREACEMTFLGTSRQTLLSIYKSEHSPVRTQLFWVTLKNIPLFVSTHLLRHTVGSIPFQLTCRNDRGGGNSGLIEKVNSIIGKMKEPEFLSAIDTDSVSSIVHELEWLQDNSDRYTPVNLGLCINAQSLIDVSKLRLCDGQAHKETVEVFQALKDEVAKIDVDLSKMMVRKCVYRGGLCGEPRCCGFNHSPKFRTELDQYISNFSTNQVGCYIKSYEK